ncbi:hypothetical protein MNBD_NITROSPINAE02-1468 [hydrothermal vent metagenome]|uniref:Flagellar hook-length control protein-like C-terminal domain-containing protein n=1 Tax=hydrothermal vent metagenome TaxID=652676 RepID=A0A3B1C8B2_9ZZZZ
MFIGQIPPGILESILKMMPGKDGESESLFQKGEMVEGKVLKTIAVDKALVRVGGVDLLATTKTKLVAGQNIVGTVEKLSPNLTISLLQGASGKEEKVAQLMRLLVPSKAPLGDALAGALSVAESVDYSPKAKEVMNQLKNVVIKIAQADLGALTPKQAKDVVAKSGLFLESTMKEGALLKLAGGKISAILSGDLKAALGRALVTIEEEIMRLAKNVEKKLGDMPVGKTGDGKEAPSREPRMVKTAQPDANLISIKARPKPSQIRNLEPDLVEITKLRESAKELKNAINNIELNQLINSSAKKEGQAVQSNYNLYQIPFFQGDSLDTARVYLRPGGDKEGSGKKDNPEKGSIVFMLNMTKLGPVRVDVNVDSRNVTGSVFVLNDSVVAHVNNNLKALLAPLEAAGYTARFEVSSAKKEFVTQELENMATVVERGLINIKA